VKFVYGLGKSQYSGVTMMKFGLRRVLVDGSNAGAARIGAYSLVLGGGGGDGALGTAVAGVGGVADDDALRRCCDLVLGQSSGEGRENDSEELGMHREE
jgi:hypothetical protein